MMTSSLTHSLSQLTYKNLDLDKIIDDCGKGRVNGFKNFSLDADFDVVQTAAIEWVNCAIVGRRSRSLAVDCVVRLFSRHWSSSTAGMQPAIDVVNYTLMKIDIGFCCTGKALGADDFPWRSLIVVLFWRQSVVQDPTRRAAESQGAAEFASDARVAGQG